MEGEEWLCEALYSSKWRPNASIACCRTIGYSESTETSVGIIYVKMQLYDSSR